MRILKNGHVVRATAERLLVAVFLTALSGITASKDPSTGRLLIAYQAATADVKYGYDASGRLTGVVDASGNIAIYNYDSNGNITSINRVSANSVVVFGFSPTNGYAGQTVTISGAGFSTTASQNRVSIGGVTASVISATANQLTIQVPIGAATGAVIVGGLAAEANLGNFTVLPTPPNSVPAISAISPASGGYGDTVTISGSNFSPTSSQETVSFGSALATIVSTSPTSITVKVPDGGTSGPISVTTAGGAGVSGTSFYIIPGGYTSASIGSTVAENYGQTINLTISNPNQVYTVTFSGNAGDRVSANFLGSGAKLTANAFIYGPDGSTIYGPAGVQTIPPTNPVDPGFLLGPVVLPLSGTYTILIAPENGSTGTAQITLYSVPADPVSQLVFGNEMPVSLPIPGQNGYLTFSANAGDKIILRAYGPTQTYSEGSTAIYNPDGTALFATSLLSTLANTTTNTFSSPYVLNQTGTYQVAIDPYQSYVWTGEILALRFPISAAPNVTFGTSVTTPTISQAQPSIYYFSGSSGQRISFNFSGSTIYTDMLVYNPDSSTAISNLLNSGTSATTAYPLTQSGIYAIFLSSSTINPTPSSSSPLTFTVNNVPPNPTTTLTIDGSSTSLNATVTGQVAVFTFSGNTGTKIMLNESYTATNSFEGFTLLNPDGSTAKDFSLQQSGQYLGPYVLTQSGTYSVVTSYSTVGATGSTTMAVSSVPPSPSANISIDGGSSTVTASKPGQVASFTFAGNSGTKIMLNESYSTTNSYEGFTLINPDGTTAKDFTLQQSGQYLGPYILTQSGTYTVVTYYSYNGATGTTTLAVSSVPPDPTTNISLNGSASTLMISKPGQVPRFTFNGAIGNSISLKSTYSIASSYVGLILLNPDGSQAKDFSLYTSGSTLGPYSLTQSGTYTLVGYFSTNGATGSVTVSVSK